jgi:AcrR family transcriptional regulator
MKTQNAVHHSTPARRMQLIEAALRHFAESGVAAAPVGQICRDAGLSVSAIYHHFGGKDQLAAAVYLEGVGRFQQGYAQALEGQRGARAGIAAVVAFHLEWVAANPHWARYLFDTRRDKSDAAFEAQLAQLNEAFHARLALWFRPRIESGELRKLPFDAYAALLVGPCQELARGFLNGTMKTDRTILKPVTDAIWRALGAA